MKVVIQRCKNSSVLINKEILREIDFGLVVLSCFTEGDTIEDINYIVRKIVNLRIFDDEAGIMNKSIKDVGGSILSISQFTLYASVKKGNRPSYMKALNGPDAKELYLLFNKCLGNEVKVKTGEFGADMLVNISNDGPITIIIDSKEKSNE